MASGKRSVLAKLARFYHRSGYLRWRDADRVEKDGSKYKKGYEIRLIARSDTELFEIQRLLIEAGFNVPRPFAQGSQRRQPIYGRRQVMRFLDLARRFPGAKTQPPKFSGARKRPSKKLV